MTRASLDKAPADVAAMFDEVAPRYDRTNTVLSLGLDRTWRTAVTQALHLQPGERVLDLAAGTATSTVALARTGAQAIGCDFSLGMLREGRGRGVDLVAGDALRLPFADGVFDAVTISFGLRNVADTGLALRELLRVTRPGGRLVVCEFSHPTWKPFRTAYVEYLMRRCPRSPRRSAATRRRTSTSPSRSGPGPTRPVSRSQLQDAGWSQVGWRDLTGGIVALHRGTHLG